MQKEQKESKISQITSQYFNEVNYESMNLYNNHIQINYDQPFYASSFFLQPCKDAPTVCIHSST